MEPNEYKVTVEFVVDAADLIGASKLMDKLLKEFYKQYKIEGYVEKVRR